MKITVINGSPRKGNTYKATQLFKNEMMKRGEIEFTEFFLPRDMPNFCRGCMSCFMKGEEQCPNAKYTLPVLEAMQQSDALILATPVYVLEASGAIKAFLDHFGFIFLTHRARPEMFEKKAFVLATTAGAGTGAAIKAITKSLKFWGINRVYSAGFALWEIAWESMKEKRRERFERKIKKDAENFYKEVASRKKKRPYVQTRAMFLMMRKMIKGQSEDSRDKQYWQQQGWFEENPF